MHKYMKMISISKENSDNLPNYSPSNGASPTVTQCICILGQALNILFKLLLETPTPCHGAWVQVPPPKLTSWSWTRWPVVGSLSPTLETGLSCWFMTSPLPSPGYCGYSWNEPTNRNASSLACAPHLWNKKKKKKCKCQWVLRLKCLKTAGKKKKSYVWFNTLCVCVCV